MIGVVGCHRTGKTTLAKTLAERFDFHFIETSVSSVFAEMGLDPSDTYSFSTRLAVQRRILKHLNKVYGEHQKEHSTDLVTDRTPLDLLIYTYAEVAGNNLTAKETEELLAYTEECFDVVNRRFSLVIGIQPAIAVIEKIGAGSLNSAYMDHLNMLSLGLLSDERLQVKSAYIPRNITDLDRRVEAVWSLYCNNFQNQADAHIDDGVSLH